MADFFYSLRANRLRPSRSRAEPTFSRNSCNFAPIVEARLIGSTLDVDLAERCFMSSGFVKLRRTNETRELLKDPIAIFLSSVIAIRARRIGGLNVHGLWSGPTLIGDYQRYRLNRQQYGGAQRQLKRWGWSDFTPTSRSTTTMLLDRRVCDSSEAPEQMSTDHQATTERPPRNHRAATKNKEKEEDREREYSPNSDESRPSELLLSLIPERKPDFARLDVQQSAMPLDRCAEAAPIGAVLDGLPAVANRSGSPSHRSRPQESR